MIIMLFCIFIIICIVFAFYQTATEGAKIVNAIIATVVCGVIFCLFTGAIMTKSYTRYLNDRAFFTATKEQYFNVVKVYKNHAEIDIESAAYTDFKYSGYQENIGNYIFEK